jgi:uncharacterized protein (TIGR03084 family)
MTDLLEQLLDDLAAETAELRAVVADLDEPGWTTPTPAAGWDVAMQVGHLVWTDEAAVLAAAAAEPSGKQGWDDLVATLLTGDLESLVDDAAGELARLPRPELLARWERSSADLATALRSVPAGARMPWFGPPMSAASMATARFMETWAHGRDVHDALGTHPDPTDRVRHVAHLGVRTRDFAHVVREEQPPAEPFRVELVAPSGETWTWGPEDAAERVAGPAVDFCLLVTQRVHRDDTALVATGAAAGHWLDIAQAFAGPPGAGRAAR